MKRILLIISLLLTTILKGQTFYNYNSLPDSIKKDAQYIVWEDLVDFEVINEGKAYEKGICCMHYQ
jgi:archaellum component FlaG (FlaF/FlaG flagellin family)